MRKGTGEMIKQAYRHFITISKHKWYVFKECRACGIVWQGIVHDLSKFSRIEFLSSAKYFQGDRSPIDAEKEEIGYSIAWMHHKGHNPHHWEYWIDFDKDGNIIANKIPYKYVVEMLCDWIGAGKAYSKDEWTQHSPLAYYNKVKSGRHFNEATQQLIEICLEIIDKKGLDAFHKFVKSIVDYQLVEGNRIGYKLG